MSHVHEGPLATYNSLTDGHLAGYFANSHMRRHLRKAGLVSKRGEIVSESTYRLNMSRKEHKKHVKDMLAQAIVHKTLDLERSRQAEIKKKLEEIAKIQLVRRVRNERTQLLEETLLPLLSPRSSRRARTPSPRHLKNKGGTKSQSLSSIPARNDRAMTSRRGDEDVLPLLSPRSRRRGSSPSLKAKGRSSHSKHRPYSAPGVRAESRLSQMSIEEDGDVLYLDDEGRPITPVRLDNPDENHIDTRHLHSLDTTALRKYAMLMAQMEEGRGLNSPYMMPQVPLPPKTPLSNRTPRSARRVQSASPRRPVTTDARIARLHRPETAKPHVGDQQMMCRVLMKYHGWALKLAREKMDPTQEVVIEQQHCGGNTLTVFKDRLLPGTNFEFISYRHRGYPFSLTLYLDGQMDSRVSTCCEYRHSRGAKIGGKQGHFSLLRVDGAIPCYKCQVAKGVLLRSKAPPKKPKRPSERHMEEVIVVSTKKDHDDGTQDTGTDQRVEQARCTEDEDQAVVVAVERDDLDGDDTKLKSPTKTETSYADDFEDSHSSASSKKSSGSSSSSSSDSESETETSTRKDEESKSKSTEEKFSLIEPRGEEREEAATPTPRAVEQEERDAGDRSARSPRSPRSPRTPRTPRVEVNGTGREIDDYSSDDDDDDKKNKVISMEGVEAETKPIRRRRSVSSSSSSSDNSDSDGRQQRRGQTNTIISVDLLDKEEREQENARKDKAKRDELQRQEADELLQRQRRENAQRREEERRAEEARRQEDRYEQQQREEARRRREEQERQQRDEQEESRRHALLIEQDAQAREEERLRAQRLREEQIMEEQRQREARRREEERAREERWQEEQARREERRRKEEEERAERKRQLEEGSSSARTESSTARTSSSEASSSSEESTPRRTGQSELTAHGERERAASPLPPAAVYEDRRQLRGDSAPPPQRPVSPLPPAAVYQERPKRRQETVTAASTQPVPEAAVYRERPRFPATEEPAPVIGLNVQPPSPDEPRKQHTARSSSSATQDSSSSSEEEEEEKEESRFQVDQQEYLRFRVLSTRFTDAVAKKPEEDDEASHPNLRYQSKRSDEVSDSEEEEAGAARYQRNQQASKCAEDEDSGTADSSSDSTSSSGSDSDRSITKDSAADSQHVQDTTEAAVSGENPDSHVRTTSESDGENMHGGADPDNVAQQETVGELLPLRTLELPAAKSHDGKVSELLTSRESVELSNVLLNKTQVYEVASHLEQADTVKMISLCNTGLDDDDMQRLSEAITTSPSEPVMLNLSLNALTQKSMKHVLNVLKAKPSIKLLILQSNPVGDKGAEELVQGLQDLHRQARANRHAAATATTADSNTADTLSMDSSASSNIDPVTASRRYLLQELDLTDTGLGDKGAEHVAQLLTNNVYVESLGLSHNGRISAQDGWSHIGEALAKNRCLRTLSLDGNRLGDEGVEHLARGLRGNRGLRSLTLEDAGVGVEGGKRLMEMLKRNTTLLELTLSPGNSIPDELVEDIKKYIALNRAPYDNFRV